MKLRLTTAAGVYIVRFAGLGRVGAEKMSRAEAMFAAGFTPEPIALRRGLLLERWIAGQPLAPFAVNRASLVDHLGAYIAFRARAFPAAADRGASVATLAEMASVNALELGGDALREQVRISLEALDVDETRLRPIHMDGRLHAWEWVRAEDGRLIKTDAMDHAGAHDLIGPQDPAWDIAGALTEFELSAAEQRRLLEVFAAQAGVTVDPDTLSAFRIFYLAFQAGWWAMAAQAGDTATIDRARARSTFYAAPLAHLGA